MRTLSEFASTGMSILEKQEEFWLARKEYSVHRLLQYSLFLGFFPFAGYLVNYTIRGTIWNIWPFVHTTLDVGSGLVFAGMQWIFFSVFSLLASLFLDMIGMRWKVQFEHSLGIITYAITPLSLSLLFVGVPYVDRILTTLGFAAFLFLLYYGFRLVLSFTILRSLGTTFGVFVLFALIRQMFVFAIGY